MKKLLLLIASSIIALFCWVLPAHAFTLIQTATGTDTGLGSSFTITPASNVTAGNLLACSIAFSTGNTPTSFTDNKSDTWASSTTATTTAQSTQIWWAQNAAGGATTITVNLPTTGIDAPTVCEEWSGVATTSAMDVNAISYDGGQGGAFNQHVTTSSPTTATSSELLLVGGNYQTTCSGSVVASGSYSNILCENGTSGYVSDIMEQATTSIVGSYIGAWQGGGFVAGTANLVAFKPPAASGGGAVAVFWRNFLNLFDW